MISHVTDTVLEEVRDLQNRPLEKMYPIVYLDAIRVKCRDDGRVENKSVYLAKGVSMEGQKKVLGFWVSQNEGAKFWLSVENELRALGEEDILIACVSYKDRKVIEKDLKTIYKSVTAKKAEAALGDFKVKWNGRYPTIGKSWREKGQNAIPFFAFPEDVRKSYLPRVRSNRRICR